ncbi:MAG TPA: hypothetical protein VGJ64_05795 [Gemmatimonadaceae bacterium]|jgi:hypothetical protein
MSSRTPWTDEELRLLKELIGRNVSLPVMALKLGRSVAAIEAKASQQGIALTRIKRANRRRAGAQLDVPQRSVG